MTGADDTDCDDGNACTADACAPDSGCSHGELPDCGAGDCCAAHGALGCGDSAAQECVCALQPTCCTGGWDAGCAALAAADCNAGCPGPEYCCVERPDPGCPDPAVEAAVCAEEPACCEAAWGSACVTLAASTPVCGSSCPDCSDDDVCTGDGCLGQANECVNIDLCSGSGDCYAVGGNGSPFCEDPACANLVCAQSPSCCSGTWDPACATLADQICKGCPLGCDDNDACTVDACVDDVCQSSFQDATCCGDGVTGGAASCTNKVCQACVCAADDFCCTGAWDGYCDDCANGGSGYQGACQNVDCTAECACAQCSDGDACTPDVCDPASGACANEGTVDCDDQDPQDGRRRRRPLLRRIRGGPGPGGQLCDTRAGGLPRGRG